MNCKLCGASKKLIKAHIIPESFFTMFNANESISISTQNNSYPKRRPIGEYDEQILCDICEKHFQSVDEYASDFFLKKYSSITITKTINNHSFDVIQKFDYEKLKLFFISILWRASVSNQSFFESVDLGSKYEKQAQDLILEKASGRIDDFSIVLTKYIGDPFANQILFSPIPERWFGIRYYRFFLGIVTAHIKVDQRNSPEHMCRLQLHPKRPLIVPHKDITSTEVWIKTLIPALESNHPLKYIFH